MSKKKKAKSLLKNQYLNYALVGLMIVAAFVIGNLWTKVQYLEAQGSPSGNANNAVGNNAPSNPQAPQPTPQTTIDDVAPVTEDDYVRGNRNARLLLIEYSDLECPFCKRFHDTAKQLVEEYNEVAWVYRHFPLESIHSKAKTEAIAAECAGSLGGEQAFWAYVDRVFEVTPANNGLDLDRLLEFAADVGLNVNAFNECLESEEFATDVEEDLNSGLKAGVRGTPGNIIIDTQNDEIVVLPGAVPYEQLKQAVDQLLSRS